MLKKRELLQLFGQILKLQYDAELVGMMMFASFFSFSLKKSHDVIRCFLTSREQDLSLQPYSAPLYSVSFHPKIA